MNYSQSLCPNPGKSLFFCLLFVVFSFLGTVIVYAAPGWLDLSFGNGGKVLVPVGTGEFARDIKVQSDGKIVVVGETTVSSSPNYNRDFAVLRLNPNGTLDSSFGNNGVVTTDMGTWGDTPFAVAIQPDNKIVVVGHTHSDTFQDIALARYNSDGNLDSAFGNGGKIVMPLTDSEDYLLDVVVQSDGKILASGFARKDFFTSDLLIVRYMENGVPDAAFGTNGVLKRQITQRSVASALTLQSDGKIVVAGDVNNSGQDSLLLRLNSDGTFDSTFDGDGQVIVETNISTNFFNSVEIQPDGKIVAAGSSLTTVSATGGYTVARFNQNGSLDTSFGSNGVVITPMWGNYNFLQDLAIQSDGRIIVFGYISDSNQNPQESALVRYTSSGTLDTSFGVNGIVKTPFSDAGAFSAGHLQSDGKLLIASRSDGFSVLRFQTRDKAQFDYDGDGRADISVFRPTNGAWYVSHSSNNAFFGAGFGQNGDVIAPADFDGDGRTDVSVFRAGFWHRLNSSTNQFVGLQFGIAEDVPVQADYDGDGRADIAVFRPSNGTWYRINSTNNQFVAFKWGITGDKPLIGDFDGDRKADYVVFRPSVGAWYVLRSSDNSFHGVNFGLAEDVPTPADYDSDGKTDISVFRPAAGSWYRINSSTNQFFGQQFGLLGDKPVAGDYDGDGKTDIAVFRPSQGTWYIQRSASGFFAQQFGTNGDTPTPSAFGQ
ncbi:MAG TPA: FG-GAP-like repeat-containing protein [Pyrinomonadaceae bacterium]|jgi:uncharacterized delta-60 repeat protein